MKLQHQWAGAKWLKQQKIKADKVTPFACLVADILGLVYRGLYHLPRETVFYRKAEWYKQNQITLFFYRELATHDGSELTQLILFCHQFYVRLAIRPVIVKREYEGQIYDAAALELVFTKRKPEGEWFDRHPSLEEAIAKFQQYIVTELSVTR